MVVDLAVPNQVLLVLVLCDGVRFLDVVRVLADLSVRVDDVHLRWWLEACRSLRRVRL